MMSGWIKLHRSLLDWEWYSDNNVFRVFTHILLMANFEDKRWQGKIVKRGSLVTSLSNLASETGQTIKQVRVALDKLKRTSDIEVKGHTSYSLITVVNYSKWQGCEDEEGQTKDIAEGEQRADKGQTKGTREGRQRATTKEIKNKEDKNNISSLRSDIFQENSEVEKLKKFVKPSIEEVQTYCLERSNHVNPDKFFDFYESKGWKVGANPMKDWRAAVRTWEKNDTAIVSRLPNTQSQEPNSGAAQNLAELYAAYDRLGIPHTKPEGVK